MRDESLKEAAPAHPRISPGEAGHVGPPSPGVITHVFVQLEQRVDRGEKLFTLEAMKMQSTIYAPVAGTCQPDTGGGWAARRGQGPVVDHRIVTASTPPTGFVP